MDAEDFKDLHWLLDVIQSSNIGIVVLDRTLHVEVFNRFMQAHSGIKSENAMGRSILELFPDLPEQWLWRRIETVFELGIPVYATWEERPYCIRTRCSCRCAPPMIKSSAWGLSFTTSPKSLWRGKHWKKRRPSFYY
jgi:PAS domain-containing protein